MWQRVGLLELQTVLSSLVQFLPRFVRRRLNTFHRGHATPMWSFHWTGRKRRMCFILRAVGAESAAASHSFSLDANLTLLLKSLNCYSFFFFFLFEYCVDDLLPLCEWIVKGSASLFQKIRMKPVLAKTNITLFITKDIIIVLHKRGVHHRIPLTWIWAFEKSWHCPLKGLNTSNVSVQNIADNHSHCT